MMGADMFEQASWFPRRSSVRDSPNARFEYSANNFAATIICPDDLIATVAALTLAIRVIGGSIGYCV
jgi:hypothetical protein